MSADPRILLVDDDPVILLFIRKILSKEGYSDITACEDPLQAVELLRQKRFDLLLLDLKMPGMSGLELLSWIGRHSEIEKMPVMMLTADEDVAVRHQALSGGAWDFLSKPFDSAEVIARVNNMVQLHRLHQGLQQANDDLEEKVRERTAQLQREVEERSRIERQLEHLSTSDPLTGLPSEMIFLDRLQQSMLHGQRTRTGSGVIWVQFDLHVKFSDQKRKEWLREMARLLAGVSRGGSVSRRGNRSFVILMSDLSPNNEEVEIILSRVRQRLSQQEIKFELGVATVYGESTDGALLVQQSYDNCGHGHSDGKTDSLKVLLHRAIFDHGCSEFDLVWQPQVQLDKERVTAAEVLLRWNSPQLGKVSPGQFIEVAEREGWISEISRWVIRQAIEQISQWRAQGVGLDHYSINLSSQDLTNPEVVGYIGQQLEQYGVPAEQVCIEITETELMERIEQGRKILEQLKRLGVKIALDDFGTGYSSLSYLRYFPIDILKIDRSFVIDMEEDQTSHALVKGMISIAQMLDLEVVVEGVEHASQRDLLSGLSVDWIQGYFYAAPLAADEFVQFSSEPARL